MSPAVEFHYYLSQVISNTIDHKILPQYTVETRKVYRRGPALLKWRSNVSLQCIGFAVGIAKLKQKNKLKTTKTSKKKPKELKMYAKFT